MADYVGQPRIICRLEGQQLAPESPTEGVYVWACEWVSGWVNDCVMSPCKPSGVRAPPPSSPAQVHLSQLFYGKPALLSIAIAASLHPHPLRDRTQMPLWAAGTKQGVLWGHQLVLPHGATRAMNRKTPKPSTHIISAFALEVTLSQPHRFHLVFRRAFLI